MVASPSPSSRGTVFGPAPQSLDTGNGASQSTAPVGGTTVRPSGLSWALATLATYFVLATPTETLRPVALRTRSLICRPMATGGPKRRSAPDMSRNASSNEIASTCGEKSPKIAMIWPDSAS